MGRRRDVEETDEEKKARRRAMVAAYEVANDIVPGTAWCRVDEPEGGQSWDGRARMAAARLAAGQDLDSDDHEALGRVELGRPAA